MTRAVLPVMRQQRSVTSSRSRRSRGSQRASTATVYGATKAAVSVWSEALEQECRSSASTRPSSTLARFRTDFFGPTSLQQEDVEIVDYADGRERRRSYYTAKKPRAAG